MHGEAGIQQILDFGCLFINNGSATFSAGHPSWQNAPRDLCLFLVINGGVCHMLGEFVNHYTI